MGKHYEVRITTLEYREDEELSTWEDLIGEALFAVGGSDCVAQVYDGDVMVHQQKLSGSKLLSWLSP